MSARRRKQLTDDAVAYVYGRMSLRKDEWGLPRQLDSARKYADARGWPVVAEYTDEVSAFSGRERPGFLQMLDDARADDRQVVIVAHDLDRLVRRVKEVHKLIDLYEHDGVPFVTVQGGVDLTSSAGKLVVIILTAVAEMESEHKGERLMLKYDQTRGRGIPHWSFRPFGYELPDENGHVAQRDDEATILRELYEDVVDGENLSALTRRLQELGLTQPERPVERGSDELVSKPWSVGAVRNVLRAHRNVGLIYSRREGTTHPGAWEPIVDRVTFDRAQLVLDGNTKSEHNGRNPKWEYLCTGRITCGRCGGRMVAAPRTQKGVQRNIYLCKKYAPTNHNGCGMAVSVERVDELVAKYVLGFHTDKRNKARMRAHGATVDTASAYAELDAVEVAYDTLTALVASSKLTQRRADKQLDVLNAREAAARATIARGTSSSTRSVPFGPKLVADWDELPLHGRRSLVADLVDEVVIHEPVKAGRIFDPNRVELVERFPAPGEARRAS